MHASWVASVQAVVLWLVRLATWLASVAGTLANSRIHSGVALRDDHPGALRIGPGLGAVYLCSLSRLISRGQWRRLALMIFMASPRF